MEKRLAAKGKKGSTAMVVRGAKRPSVRDEIVARIAAEVLDVETLETRKMDGLDFHDCAVWSLKEALEAAYEAGRLAAQRGVA